MKHVPLGEFMVTRAGAVTPSDSPDERFDLFSVPAHDADGFEEVLGADIGSAKQVVRPGDVMISKIVPHIRRARVVSEYRGNRQVASGEWIVFRGSGFDPSYLRHFLVSDEFHHQFMATVAGVGGSLLRARPAHVKAIRVPLPPLEEQRRIAAILDHADNVVAGRREVLVHLDSLLHSALAETLRNEVGRQPLGRSLDFITSGGRGWAKYYAEAGKRFIQSLDVRMGTINDREPAFVNPPDNAEARRTRTQVGDVLLTITGSRIGRAAPLPDTLAGSYVSQHVAILRPTRDVLRPVFLAAMLQSPVLGQRLIAAAQYGQTKPGLNFEQIRRFELPLPSVETQDGFLSRRNHVDSLRASAKSAIRVSEELRDALQFRAFRGAL